MKAQGEKKSLVILTIFSIFFIGILISLQFEHDQLANPFEYKYKIIDQDLLPTKMLPYITFGFDNMIADYYWISAIQDFVGWNGKDAFFFHYMDSVTTLDPAFEFPYLFSILVIPQDIKPEDRKDTTTLLRSLESIQVLVDRGMQAIPSSWKIPYYFGTRYYLAIRTYPQAEKYLKIAAEKKGAPAAVYIAYSSFITNSLHHKNSSRELIKAIYDTTDNEIVKKITEKGLARETVSQMLEQGILAYKTKYGTYPQTIQDLKDTKFISLPERFSDVFTITINQKDGTFKVGER